MDMGGRNDLMHHPSVMHFSGDPSTPAYRRAWSEYPHDEAFQADGIMAVKLMNREVIDTSQYRWDMVGEDLGWCHSLEELGHSRWLEPRTHGVHMYSKPHAIEVMKKFKDLSYPEIYPKLTYWYNDGEAA